MLKQKIENGEKTIGMYVQLADSSISKIVGLAGYDFIWVDNEHSYMSSETLLNHIFALRSVGAEIVVRVPQNDLTHLKHVLEMGVDGIILPMVRSAEEANEMIAATLYPPLGTRGFGPMNAIDYGFMPAAAYAEKSNRDLCRFIQIEHKDAVEHLAEIIRNPYIDGYIIGPNDLSGSYGMLGEVFSDTMTGIIRGVVDYLHQNGKSVGIAAGGCTEDVLAHWSSFDVDLLTGGADFDFLREMAIKNRALLEKIHKTKR